MRIIKPRQFTIKIEKMDPKYGVSDTFATFVCGPADGNMCCTTVY